MSIPPVRNQAMWCVCVFASLAAIASLWVFHTQPQTALMWLVIALFSAEQAW